MSEIKSDHCFILLLFTGRCCIRQVSDFVCLRVSEIKSDQCFMLCLFTWRYYIDVNVYDCVFVCLFVSVLLPVCEYLSVSEMKSDQCLFSSVSACV